MAGTAGINDKNLWLRPTRKLATQHSLVSTHIKKPQEQVGRHSSAFAQVAARRHCSWRRFWQFKMSASATEGMSAVHQITQVPSAAHTLAVRKQHHAHPDGFARHAARPS